MKIEPMAVKKTLTVYWPCIIICLTDFVQQVSTQGQLKYFIEYYLTYKIALTK